MSNLDLTEFTALTFDCYGTLIDWERGIRSVLGPWSKRHALGATDEELLDAFGAFEHRCQEEMPQAAYPDILRAVHDRIAERFGVRPDRGEADALAGSIKDWPVFTDSPGALRRLQRRFKLLILSNIDRRSFAYSNAKLGVVFDAVITAEDVGGYKPSHGHFTRAFDLLGRMGVERGEILHVAQSLYHDHAPAKALGMRTVWVHRRRGKTGAGVTPPPPSEVRPDLVVSSLGELADIVDRG